MQENDFEYVGFWPRVGATIIDAIITAIITLPILVFIYGADYLTDPDVPFIAGPADFLISWVLPAIAVILFWLYKRATPGKMVVSAQIVDARTGKSLTVEAATLLTSLPCYLCSWASSGLPSILANRDGMINWRAA